MKKSLSILSLVLLMLPMYSASEIPEVACPYVYDFSNNVGVGDGGQNYVTDVMIDITGALNILMYVDLYDWMGNYIESVTYDGNADYNNLEGRPAPGFTGLVDGTYTFIINDTFKGTFNVNHEMQGLLIINTDMYSSCYRDAEGHFIDINELNYEEQSGLQSEVISEEQSELQSEVISEEKSSNDTQVILLGIVIGILLTIIVVLGLVVYYLKKGKTNMR